MQADSRYFKQKWKCHVRERLPKPGCEFRILVCCSFYYDSEVTVRLVGKADTLLILQMERQPLDRRAAAVHRKSQYSPNSLAG